MTHNESDGSLTEFSASGLMSLSNVEPPKSRGFSEEGFQTQNIQQTTVPQFVTSEEEEEKFETKAESFV